MLGAQNNLLSSSGLAIAPAAHDGNDGAQSQSKFRGDIEALRGVAVISVILYHFFPHSFAGGFAGVDVFFVISGFVISLMTDKWLAEKQFSLPRFYAMRFRRLLPAAAFLICGVVVYCVAFEPRCLVMPSARAALAAATFQANYYFLAEDTDYNADHDTPSPFLHFWSLAVEEQFYFVFPLLVGAGRWTGQRAVTVVLGCLAFGSFVLSIWLSYQHMTQRAFYTLESRLWELALGCLLLRLQQAMEASTGSMPTGAAASAACSESTPEERQRCIPCCPSILTHFILRRPSSWLGSLLLALGLLFTRLDFWFPAPGAVVIVVGTCVFILAGPRAPANEWLASIPFLRSAGRLSYSLYLWHWPVIALGRLDSGAFGSFVFGVCFALLLAACSFYWIEDVFRKVSSVKRGFLVGLCCLVLSTSVSLLAAQTRPILPPGLPVPDTEAMIRKIPVNGSLEQHLQLLSSSCGAMVPLPPNLVPPLHDPARGYSAFSELRPCALKSCVFPIPNQPTSPRQALKMVLLGDSHAAHWFRPVHRVAQHFGFELTVRYANSCPFTTNADSLSLSGDARQREHCQRFVRESQRAALAANVTVISRWVDDSAAGMPSPDAQKQLHLARAARAGNSSVTWLIGDTPGSPDSCVLAQAAGAVCLPPRSGILKADQIMNALNAIPGMFYTPMVPLLCSEQPTGPSQSQYACPSVLGNILVGMNADHISGQAGKYLSHVIVNFLQDRHPGLWGALCAAAGSASDRTPLGCPASTTILPSPTRGLRDSRIVHNTSKSQT